MEEDLVVEGDGEAKNLQEEPSDEPMIPMTPPELLEEVPIMTPVTDFFSDQKDDPTISRAYKQVAQVAGDVTDPLRDAQWP
ncbi:unnamed protein product [Caretta caretta]